MCTGYKFEPSHRMRIVVTNADFPVLWPTPYKIVTVLYTSGDRAYHIELPALPKLSNLSAILPPLDEPRRKRRESWFQVNPDFDKGVTTAHLNLWTDKITCRVKADDPASALLETRGTSSAEAGNRRIEARSEGSLRTTEDSFILNMKVTLLENDKEVRSQEWKDKVKRELV